MYDLLIVGGGAAGMFAAANAKGQKVALLEKSAVLLAKVKVSGGGRCNVTHACFDPNLLVRNYPRGSQELRGPFHRFQPRDTIQWFESRGVPLKVEEDERIFPVSDSSQSVIDCLLEATQGVEIRLRERVDRIEKVEGGFQVGAHWGKKLILATGSSLDGYRWAEALGHTIQNPVPSLFTFNVPTSPLKELSGLSVSSARLEIVGMEQTGPLLITHFGFSGPAALKLSAWGARILHEKGYKADLKINWLPEYSAEELFQKLVDLKKRHPERTLIGEAWLPKNLWRKLISDERRLNDFSLKELRAIAEKLTSDVYAVDGKTTHKEEFVTCGGVTLKEVNFKTMESKICPGLYFAGEILDIDGVTGGFNFQNAWTTAFIASSSAQT